MDDNLTGVWWGICVLLKIDGIVSSGSESHRLRARTFSLHCHAHCVSGWVRSMAAERGGLHIIAWLSKRTMHKSTPASMSAHQFMSFFHIQCCWALISDSQNFWHIYMLTHQNILLRSRRDGATTKQHPAKRIRGIRDNYSMHIFRNYAFLTGYSLGWQSIRSNRQRVITS